MNNTTAESSFEPLEYYKKLTKCLANRKNLRLNVSRINGINNLKKNAPLLTMKNVQLKFLEKYKNKRQQQERNTEAESPKVLFNIKQSNGNNKRKNDESFIYNLPDSFFKSREIPNVSLFKMPAVPSAKKQKMDFNPSKTNTTSNLTVASLFSGMFQPTKCSTPIEVPKAPQKIESIDHPVPIISDPNEILEQLNELPEEEAHVNKNENLSQILDDERKQMRIYEDLMEKSAQCIDSVCFLKMSDPVEDILNKLNENNLVSTQLPRESLLSDVDQNSQLKTPKKHKLDTQAWPVPVFYDQEENKVNETNCTQQSMSMFEQTKELFSFLDDDNDATPFDLNLTTSTVFNCLQEKPSKLSLFSPVWPESPFQFDTPKKKFKDIDWLENAFTNMDMSWEIDNSDFYDHQYRSKISPIFRSPPHSNRLNIQENFSGTISRPKKECCKNSNDSLWWMGTPSEVNFSLGTATPNLFDSKFNLF